MHVATKHPVARALAVWGLPLALACSGPSPSGASTARSAAASSNSSVSTGSGAPPDGPTTPEEFVDAFLRTSCEQTLSCRFGKDQDVRLVMGNLEQCLGWLRYIVGDELNARVKAVQRGSFSYDSVAAQRCLWKLSNSCGLTEPEEAYDAADTFCAEVFDGNVPNAGACSQDVECQGDAYCSASNGVCAGRCTPRAKPGEPCDRQSQCGGAGDEQLSHCVTREKRCESFTLPAAGNPTQLCGSGSTDGSWRDTKPCEAGRFCFLRESTGLCLPPVKLGETCQGEGDVCEDGALCVGLPDGQGPGTCQKVNITRSAGGPCGVETLTACASYAGLRCDEPTKTCQDRRSELAGPCSDSTRYLCVAGSYCAVSPGEQALGTCQPRLPLDAPCSENLDCESGRCATRGGTGKKLCSPLYCGAE